MVRKLKYEELLYISKNFYYSKHSKDRISERLDVNDDVEYLIKSSKFAYVNTDDTINVGFKNNKYYFVFAKYGNKYKMITCKEPSKYTTLHKKYILALKGVERKDKKYEEL